MGDNFKGDRYGYLIIVRTGAVRNSDTTSNVMMKIKGTEGETSGNVLNFPDPEREMFRRGDEDRFVLSTNKYLGNVLKMVLWIDAVGRDAAW